MKINLLKKKGIIVFLFSLIFISVFTRPVLSDPASSRVATIRAMVEQKTLEIENINIKTIDKIGREGHLYSTKPPLLTLYASGWYYIFYNLFEWKFDMTMYYWLTLLSVGVLFALLMSLFYKALMLIQVNNLTALLFTFALGVSTLIFPYATNFNNHTVAATFIFASFYYLLKIQLDKSSKKRLFLVGLFLSMAITTEFAPSVVIAAITTGYLLLNKKTRRDVSWFILGTLPLLSIYAYYNTHITGNIFPAYLNKELYRYPGSYWLNTTGIDALDHNKFLYFFNTLLGTHGLFIYSPILLFGLWGIIKTIREKSPLKNLAWLTLITIGSVLAFIVTFTNNYAGATYGLRWLIIIYPCLFFFVGYKKEIKKQKDTIFFSVFFYTMMISFMIGWIGMSGFPRHEYNWGDTILFFPLLDGIQFLLAAR